MDECPAPQAETNEHPPAGGAGRPRLRLAVAVAVLLCVAALPALCWRRLWRPLPVVPVLPRAPDSIARPDVVRVVVASSAPGLEVACPEGAVWYSTASEGRTFLDMGQGPWQVSAPDGGLRLDGVAVPGPEAELLPNEDRFVLGTSAYRGSLTMKARSGGRVRAINVVDPEQYVGSVVGSEMYSRWPLEALMAQAVAARTFMLHTVADRGYMVPADMAYRGVGAESRAARLATGLTEGIVLTYDGRVLPAYFHSTCGGRTVAADRVFAMEPLPPLQGVDCPWCRGSHWYEWRFELAGEVVAELLEIPGLEEVRAIQPLDAEPDGYARYVLINDERKLAAGALRRALGGNRMRSTRFSVSSAGGVFTFEGRGYGHGVGLCQWGARGLARAGRTWQEILLHYYPGAAIQKAY